MRPVFILERKEMFLNFQKTYHKLLAIKRGLPDFNIKDEHLYSLNTMRPLFKNILSEIMVVSLCECLYSFFIYFYLQMSNLNGFSMVDGQAFEFPKALRKMKDQPFKIMVAGAPLEKLLDISFGVESLEEDRNIFGESLSTFLN